MINCWAIYIFTQKYKNNGTFVNVVCKIVILEQIISKYYVNCHNKQQKDSESYNPVRKKKWNFLLMHFHQKMFSFESEIKSSNQFPWATFSQFNYKRNNKVFIN